MYKYTSNISIIPPRQDSKEKVSPIPSLPSHEVQLMQVYPTVSSEFYASADKLSIEDYSFCWSQEDSKNKKSLISESVIQYWSTSKLNIYCRYGILLINLTHYNM